MTGNMLRPINGNPTKVWIEGNWEEEMKTMRSTNLYLIYPDVH